jgi:hypothetical protein
MMAILIEGRAMSARDFQAEIDAIKAWDVSDDPFGTKWLAQQQALKDVARAKERAEFEARIEASLAADKARKAEADAVEAARLGFTPEGYAFLMALAARLDQLEGKDRPRGALAMDDFGRAHSANALMDRATMPRGAALAMADGPGVDLRDRRSQL